MPIYDAIVLGAGGVGSAVLMHLAQRGARVVGVDRFHPPHDLGSSHGQTRVTRQAYFEHPDYVPLVLQSFRCWADLEGLVGRKLFHQVGLLEVGPADGVVVPGVQRAAEEHGLAVETLTPAEVHSRWPGLRVPDHLQAVFETSAGYLLVEECVRAHLQVATSAGAELRTGRTVHQWTSTEDQVTVHTDDGVLTGRKLVVAAGAWSADLLAELQISLSVRRKSLFWFRTQTKEYATQSGLPVYLFELPTGIFYGFPELDPRGVKVGEHSGGQRVVDPWAIDRSQLADDERKLRTFLEAHMPGVGREVTGHTVCMYTMTPDENFVVDRHPHHENVVFAAGLSGHGFKFTGVLGQALADLALEGRTDLPIRFLSLARFASS